MKQKLEYLLKHNRAAQFCYRFIIGFFFRFIGLFVRQDMHLIMFSSFGGRKYNDSPRVLFEKMRDMCEFDGYKMIWAFEKPDEFRIQGAQTVKIDSFKYFIYCLKAGIWITSVNIERGLKFKKKRTYYVNTWHGAGTKRIGNGCSGRKDYNFSNVDLMLVQSEFEKNIFIEDFNCKEDNIQIIGFPRNDQLFHLDLLDKKAIRKRIGIPSDKKVILYAPTWRDSLDGGATYEVNPPINIKLWKEKLSSRYVVLFRMHAFTNKFTMAFDEFAIDVSKYENLNEILSVTDILITDYSTIVYDSAVARIPFLCFGFDYDQYREVRGFYFDLRNEYPCGVIEDETALLEKLMAMRDKRSFDARYEQFREKYIQAGGNATAIVISNILNYIKSF